MYNKYFAFVNNKYELHVYNEYFIHVTDPSRTYSTGDIRYNPFTAAVNESNDLLPTSASASNLAVRTCVPSVIIARGNNKYDNRVETIV